MAETVIDKLVVTLGLDPKQFGSQAQAAASRLEQFNNQIKKLNVDETKLTDVQKKHIQALRDIAVQGERTGKELSAVGAIGKEMWGVLEKGAVGFGAALGLYGLKDLAADAIHANTQIKNLAGLMGMLPAEADAFKQAVQNVTGGSGEGALGSLRGLSNELNAYKSGQPMSQQLLFAAARAQVSLFDNNNQPIETEEAALRFADYIKKIGLTAAGKQFAGIFDDETLVFLSQGRKADEAALAASRASVPSSADFDEAKKAAEALNKLSNAASNLKDIFVLMGAPGLTAGLKNLTTWIEYFRGTISAGERDRQIAATDAALLGADEVRKRQAQSIVSGMAGPGTLGSMITDFVSDLAGEPTVAWSNDQRVARAAQLLASGEDAGSIPGIIRAEEAAGRTPGTQAGTAGIGGGAGFASGAPTDALLDAIERVESGGRDATSPAGAQGPFQFMPGTWAKYGQGSVHDPVAARAAARKYLSDLYAEFGDTDLAIAGYNMNPDNLKADVAQAKAAFGNDWKSHLWSMPGFPRETRDYVPKVEGALGGAAAFGQGGSNVTINQTGPVNISVASGDPRAIASGWHQAVTAQANSGIR